MNFKDFLKKFLIKFKNPSATIIVISAIVAVLFIVAALVMLTVDYTGTALEIIAYVCFAAAAISLAYVVYIIVLHFPKLKNKIKNFTQTNKYTAKISQNYNLRTLVFSSFSLALTVAMGVYNAYLGIVNRSGWFGFLAIYYIVLVLLRGGILLFHGLNKYGDDPVKKIKSYRSAGILLLLLTFELSFGILQMVMFGYSYTFAGMFVIAVAAYAFYKISMAVYNVFQARKRTADFTVQAIRNINLCDAMVTILALQTALLTVYDEGTIDIGVFNALTGAGVCILTVALAIYMIIKANKSLKELSAQSKLKSPLINTSEKSEDERKQ